jgi:hypothetical protein
MEIDQSDEEQLKNGTATEIAVVSGPAVWEEVEGGLWNFSREDPDSGLPAQVPAGRETLTSEGPDRSRRVGFD